MANTTQQLRRIARQRDLLETVQEALHSPNDHKKSTIRLVEQLLLELDLEKDGLLAGQAVPRTGAEFRAKYGTPPHGEEVKRCTP